MKSLFPLLLFLLLSIAAFTQEQLGLRTGNYAGINGAPLNPAMPLLSPDSWQVNLAEGAFFVTNNYAYLDRTSLLDLYRNRENLDILYGPDLASDEPVNGRPVLYFYDRNSKYFGTVAGSVMGPSFYLSLGENFRLGVISRARTFIHSQGISDYLGYDRYYNRDFQDEFSVEPVRGGLLSWSEVGLNLALNIPLATGQLGIGFTAKYLNGYESGFIHLEDRFQLTKLSDESLSARAFSLTGGYTTSNLSGSDFNLQSNGAGLGVDLGLIYTDEGEEAPYRWRLGFSLLDLGGIRFDQATRLHEVSRTDPVTLDINDYNSVQGPEDLDSLVRIFSTTVLNDPEASLTGDNYFMWLPTAVSLQVDHAFTSSFFVNATLLMGLPLGNITLERGSVLAVTPRLEQRWYGIAMPLSLYNWQQLRLGLSARLGPLVLGTDKLGGLINKTQLSGADFYLALRVNPFGSGNRDRYRVPRTRRSRGNGPDIKCYEF